MKPVVMTLLLGVLAFADTKGRTPQAYSAWEPVVMERDGVVPISKQKDFNDSRFEYRWTTETTAVGIDVCTIELRPTDDAGVGATVPHVSFSYVAARGRNHQLGTASDVVVATRDKHAVLKASGCARVTLVYWSK